MGAFTSRQNEGSEDTDATMNDVYRYPPKSAIYLKE
jgi:hypothetical protein